MALDIEALLLNFSPDHNMMRPRVLWASLIIQVCGLPLVAVTTAALLYGLAGPRLGLSNPVRALAARWRVPLGLLILLCWFAYCVPAALGLASWSSVEVTWWIQWYENVLPTTEEIIFTGPLIFGPSLAALGALLALLSMSRPRDPASGKRRLPVRVLGWLVTLLILAALLPAAAVAGLHGHRVALVPGESAFRTRCDKCHERSLALYYVKTPEEWKRTVDRQSKKEDANITDEEKEKITAFITGMRSFPDAWTFRSRCQRCHGTSTWSWTERDPKEWDAIVDRLARWSPYYYRREVRAQVKRHLHRTLAEEGATLDLPGDRYAAYHRLADRCGTCHSISRSRDRISKLSDEELTALLQRMNQKMVKRLTPAELKALGATYRELMADPKRFDHLFPHDRMVEDERLPW